MRWPIFRGQEKKMRTCLYARYSTDRQRETSIEDQLRSARERVAREGWQIVGTHADEGVSGSTPVALRRGGKALLADALAGRFDVLIVEGLDRISRELSEAESVVKRLEHRGIRIIGTADGYDSGAHGRKVMRIARGLVNEMYLDDLREKTHRGLAGSFDRGMSTGGRSYGYRTEEAASGRRLVIDPVEAAVVREVFEAFADGHSVRAIVHRLNERGVPSARGGHWAVSALQGSAAKGLGMLHNSLYAGRVVWNRRQWLKDPDTGKRRYVERPQTEWQERFDPSLRIIDDSLWKQVQDRVRSGPARGTRAGGGQVPRTLFGGLLRCEQCGGPMVAISATRYGCNLRFDRGDSVCPNRRTVLREVVDRRLVAEVRSQLLGADALADLQAAARRVLADSQRDSGSVRDAARKRLGELDAEVSRLVDAIATVGVSAALADRLRAAEAERADLRGKLQDSAAADPARVLDGIVSRYRAMLLQLEAVLRDEDRDRTRAILADIIGPVTILHEGSAIYAELEDPAARLLVAGGGSTDAVAGARNFHGRRRIRLV